MARPPKTGPTKYKAHLLGDDRGASGKAWCGHRFSHRHRIAGDLNRVTCRKCKALMKAALAAEQENEDGEPVRPQSEAAPPPADRRA